jgi:hypothetical protein
VYSGTGRLLWTNRIPDYYASDYNPFFSIDLNGDERNDVLLNWEVYGPVGLVSTIAFGSDGSILWSRALDLRLIQLFSVNGTSNFIIGSYYEYSSPSRVQGLGEHLVLLDGESGKQLWDVKTRLSGDPVLVKLLNKDVIAFAANSNSLEVLDMMGQTVWISSELNIKKASQVVIGDVGGEINPEIFVGGENSVYILNSAGSLIGEIKLGNPFGKNNVLEAWSVLLEDLNGDNFKEIIVAGAQRIKVFELNLQMVWEMDTPYLLSSFSASNIGIGKVTSDKNKQIFFTEFSNQGQELVALSLSIGQFTPSQTSANPAIVFTPFVTYAVVAIVGLIIGAVIIALIIRKRQNHFESNRKSCSAKTNE